MTTRTMTPPAGRPGPALATTTASAIGLALCTTLVTAPAQGAPVIVDIPDRTLGTYDLDINADGTVEFGFQRAPFVEPFSFFENDVNTYVNAVVGHVVPPTEPAKPGTYADRLASGELIDASRQFVSGDSVILSGAKPGSLSWGEFFEAGRPGYVGLRFQLPPDDGTHYGWAEATAHDGTVTLTRYGYESEADTGIVTPGAAVAEPGTLALLVMGAAGVASLRRRRT